MSYLVFFEVKLIQKTKLRGGSIVILEPKISIKFYIYKFLPNFFKNNKKSIPTEFLIEEYPPGCKNL